MTRLLCGLLLFLASACAAPAHSAPNEELAQLEACCRWYMADQELRCVALTTLFVPAELVARIQPLGRRVRPVAEAVDDPHHGVVDRASGQRGTILRAQGARNLPDGRVEVQFDAYAGPEGDDRATLTLVRDGQGWRVTDARVRATS